MERYDSATIERRTRLQAHWHTICASWGVRLLLGMMVCAIAFGSQVVHFSPMAEFLGVMGTGGWRFGTPRGSV
jgi:hypothetical protein